MIRSLALSAAGLFVLAAAAPQAEPPRLDPKSDQLVGPYLRPEATAKYGYLELAYPKSFQTDGKGSLKTKPAIQAHSSNVEDDVREWLVGGCEAQGDVPPTTEILGSVCQVLASTRTKTRLVPYMDRYLAAGGKGTPIEMQEYVAGLARLGRTREAENHYYQSALRWGTMSANIAAELYGTRFQVSWHVEKNFSEMLNACRDGMRRGLSPGDANLIQETLCDFIRLAAGRNELPWFVSRMDKDWIWINERRLKGVVDVFTKAGVAPPEPLLVAADPLFKENPVAPEALFHRAVESLDAGETALAVRQAERGYALGKAASLGQHFQSLVILTRILRHRGDLEQAFAYTEEAEQVAKKIKDLPEQGWALVMKGYILERLADYRLAAIYQKKAMEIGRSLGYDELEGTATEAMARVLSHTGMAADVQETLRESAESALSHRLFTKVPSAYSNWGACLLQLKRYADALKAYRRAVEPVKEVGEGFHMEFILQVDCHRGIGASLFGLQRYVEAEKAYDDYAALVEKSGVKAFDWAWQLGKAKCRLALKDPEGAQTWIDRCLGSIESERASLKDFQNRRSLNDNKYEAYELAMELALEKKDPAAAFRIAERSRARTFLDEMGAHSGELRAAPTADLPALAESCREISMVVYYQLRDRLLAWVISDGKWELVTIDLGPDELQGHILNFLHAIYLQSLTLQDKAQVLGPKPDVVNSGKGLYFALWTPLSKLLPAGKPVCIVAHGALHYVPFQALRNQNRHLIEEREIFYAPSGSAYLELQRRRIKPGKKVLVFDPILSDDPKSPFAKTESLGLQTRYPGGTFVLRNTATLAAFQAQAPGAGVIHISSHGYYNPWVPLASGLLFAGTGGQEHALLMAKDIYGMALKETELIVMSACVSSVGDFSTGDEVTGLTRAFQVAGVPNVIGSLWPVENDATIELMDLFHAALAETRNPSMALRKAQMQMISRQASVVKWAAFQLTGLGGPLTSDPGK